MFNIDKHMGRLNERVMSGAQHALDELDYALDEMEAAAEGNPDREDIKACVAEVKAKSKKALAECWAAANHWSEHFDGIDSGEDADCDDKGEPTEDTDNDNGEE